MKYFKIFENINMKSRLSITGLSEEELARRVEERRRRKEFEREQRRMESLRPGQRMPALLDSSELALRLRKPQSPVVIQPTEQVLNSSTSTNSNTGQKDLLSKKTD